MKRLLCIIVLMFALVCMLTSCNDNEPTVSVNDNGFVIVNGTKTEYKIHTTDEISVNADGYVVVNGVTTEIVADKDDVILVTDDGYVVVNGIKTEYKVNYECDHDYKIAGSKASTCIESGYTFSQCTRCQSLKMEEDERLSHHTFADAYACHDRQCVTPNCTHVEIATTPHEYNNEYVCRVCKDKKACDLETIARDFSADMFQQARINAGTMTGTFEIVIFDRENTLTNIENYIFSANLDKSKIVKGLFVKFDVTNGGEDVLFTIYYNFGLQFSETVSDIGVSYQGSYEVWMLEAVEANPTIVFEYSITGDPLNGSYRLSHIVAERISSGATETYRVGDNFFGTVLSGDTIKVEMFNGTGYLSYTFEETVSTHITYEAEGDTLVMICEDAIDLYNNGNAQSKYVLLKEEVGGETYFVLEASNGIYHFSYYVAERI